MKRFFRNNGLSIVVLTLFLAFWFGQLLAGRAVYNHERGQNGESPLGLDSYVFSAHALEATAENWESEFLQMCAFALFTAFLMQRGSAESKDPEATPETTFRAAVPPDAPWPVRRGGWMLLWCLRARPAGWCFPLVPPLRELLHSEERDHGQRRAHVVLPSCRDCEPRRAVTPQRGALFIERDFRTLVGPLGTQEVTVPKGPG